MRYCFLPVILIILGACSYNHPQPPPTSSPTIEVEQVFTATPKVQFVQVTSTPTPIDEDVEQQPTTANRAFEDGLPLAARVNDQPVFLDAYQKQIAQFEQALKAQQLDIDSAEGQAALRKIQQQVLESLVDQLIIEQQAGNLGVTITDDKVKTRAEEVIARLEEQGQFEAWLVNNDLTYQEFIVNLRSQLIAAKTFEHITQNVPETAEQIRLRVIRLDDRVTAQTIITQLKIGASFTTLAQTQSLDEVGQTNGGDLGWFPQKAGIIPSEVETIAFALQPGEVSGPIQDTSGFYIIKLEKKETERPLTSDMLYILKKQVFADWLLEQRLSTTIERYVGL